MGSVIFYTQPTLYRSTITQTAGNIADGYSVTSMLDKTLDTTYKANTSVASQIFLIDLYPQDEDAYAAGRGAVYEDTTGTWPYFTTSGSSGNFDTLGFWLKNYQEASATAAALLVHNLTSPSESPTASNRVIDANWTNSGENGLFLIDTDGTTTTKRYVVIGYAPAADQPAFEISHTFILKKRIAQTTPRWPQKIVPRYYNKLTKMLGGREYIAAEAGNKVFEFDQDFTFLSDANEQVFLDTFDDCRGRLLPLIYQPGTVVTDAYTCRLGQDTLNKTQTYRNYFKAKIKFKTLPYKLSGDNF